MAFPTTEQGLKDAGYSFEGAAKCKGCGAEIVWYRTPKGKMTPLDEGTLVSHFGTCPKAQDFKRDRNPKSDAPSSKDDGYRG
jgi:hypothetical protein